MATHRKSIIRESLDRLDSLMAIGESRGKAKQEARAAGMSAWAFSTGKIHSYKTRSTYQEQTLRFVGWARSTYGIKRLEYLDTRADDLASVYLHAQLNERKSASTLLTIRSALRLFFANRSLAENVPIPKRNREDIIRSRGPKTHDRHFQPKNWPGLVHFLQATGLRSDEVKMVKVGDVRLYDPDVGGAAVFVRCGKGGKSRLVPILAGYEQGVLALTTGRAVNERLFARIPKQHLDCHSYRRGYAQALYLQYAPGRTLPPTHGRLRPTDYDREAAERVSRALGHNRIDIVHRHYLR